MMEFETLSEECQQELCRCEDCDYEPLKHFERCPKCKSEAFHNIDFNLNLEKREVVNTQDTFEGNDEGADVSLNNLGNNNPQHPKIDNHSLQPSEFANIQGEGGHTQKGKSFYGLETSGEDSKNPSVDNNNLEGGKD